MYVPVSIFTCKRSRAALRYVHAMSSLENLGLDFFLEIVHIGQEVRQVLHMSPDVSAHILFVR